MPVPQDLLHSFLARQVGTLALSATRAHNPMSLVQAASWHNLLFRLGISMPLFAIQDMGLLITSGGTLEGGSRFWQEAIQLSPRLQTLLPAYASLLGELTDGEMVRSARSLRLRDEMVAVVLHRLLKELIQRWPQRRSWISDEELPLDPGIYQNADISTHFRSFDMELTASFVAHLVQYRLYLLTAVEQIDLDTLRLMGLFSREGGGDNIVDLADLLSVFSSPQANDVVNFSLDLIPSVLETRRQSGAQVFSIDGYASIERHGSVDSVVLSEFAYDQDIFELKVLDNELYYYGHEKELADQRQLQYILVDSSASMRGVREVFARGLALTLIKKLSLQGDEVVLRFFDSRLYDQVKAGESSVPYLLSFHSERGRNYSRVFRQLLVELERIKRLDGRDVVLYIITHGQCHIVTELVERLAAVAQLYGVFILPSQALHLDYLPLLHRHQIVSEETLSSRERALDRAMEIIDDAATRRVH